jgi:TolB-like protein/tetratricopeptide (TPR) repeat protein
MPKTPSPPSPTGGGDGPSDRLDSWKEVAAHFRREISTVQRWERREGMPVHRHLHDKQGTVYAFRSELDAWWRQRGGVPASPGTDAEPADGEVAPAAALDGAPAADRAIEVRGTPRRAAITGLLLAGAVVVAAIATMLRPGPAAADITSLAVLPFEVPSGDPAQDYLAAGLTDALIAELGKVDGLQVVARESVAKYAGDGSAPEAAARALGVQAVVAGTVQRTGDRMTASARLVEAATGAALWSDSYVRDVRDVLMLQREVTLAIAQHVRTRRPPSTLTRRSRPVHPEAYDALLRARYLAVRTTDEDNRAAIALLERAIGLDAGFAPAHGELAAALVTRLAYVTPDETAELEQRAFAAAETALSLDPDVPEAFLARGDLLWSHSQRFAHERAVQEFRRALALRPNSDEAHRRLARVFVHLGFFDEAVQHASIALAINPSNAQALNSKAQATLWSGRDEDALTLLRAVPGPVLPELVEANTVFALLRLGRQDEAAAELQRARHQHPEDPSGTLPALEALMRSEAEPVAAERLIRDVQDRKAVNPSHHAAYFAALAFARMRRASDTVRWLREAADTGFPCHALFARDPLLDPVRQDPEFAAFMAGLEKQSAALKRALFAPPQ